MLIYCAVTFAKLFQRCETFWDERSICGNSPAIVFKCNYLHGDEIKKDEVGEACSKQGRYENAYNISVEKQEKFKLLTKPRCTREGPINGDLEDVGCIYLAEDRVHSDGLFDWSKRRGISLKT
jgi:hypothetical protein